MNYLGYTYAEKGIKLNESEALLAKSVALEPKNGEYLDSLIYDHLGDASMLHFGRTAEAWTIYALSHDFKSESNYIKMFSFKTSNKIKFKVFKQTKCLYFFLLYKSRQC